ncbi:hypothetical protein D3C85_1683390 [compost metagenome]
MRIIVQADHLFSDFGEGMGKLLGLAVIFGGNNNQIAAESFSVNAHAITLRSARPQLPAFAAEARSAWKCRLPPKLAID